MKRLIQLLCVAVIVTCTQLQAGPTVHNTSGATSGEDSITVAFVVTDSIANISGLDSVFVAIFNSVGDSVYAAGYVTTAAEIDSMALGTGRTVWRWTEQISDIDGSGRIGGYSGILLAIDTLDGTGIEYLDKPTTFDFQLINGEYAATLGLIGDDVFLSPVERTRLVDSMKAQGMALQSTVDSLKDSIATFDDRFAELRALGESQRGSHSQIGQGKIFFVDPVNGASHASGARGGYLDPYASVQDCHDNAVVANRHDVVMIVPGSASGVTTLTEAVTLTKNFTQYRSTGLDLLWTRSGSGNTITVTADGVGFSGFQLNTAGTGSGNGFDFTDADDFWIWKVRINDTRGDGIHILRGDNGVIEQCDFLNTGTSGAGQGIDAMGTSGSVNGLSILDCLFAGVNGNAIQAENGTINNLFIRGCVIEGATGWGISLGAASVDGFIIENKLGNNTSGDIDDGGTNTTIINNEQWGTADSVNAILDTLQLWDTRIDSLESALADANLLAKLADADTTGHTAAGTIGETWALFSYASADSLEGAIADANKSNFMATGFATHSAADVWTSGTRTLTAFTFVFDSLDYDDTYWAKLAGVSDSGAATSGVWSTGQRDSLLAALEDDNLLAKLVDQDTTGHTGDGTFGGAMYLGALDSTPWDSLDFTADFWQKVAGVSDSGAATSGVWSTGQRDSLLNTILDANKGNFKATGFSTHTAADVWTSGTRTLTAFAFVFDSLDFTDDFWEKLAGVSDSGSAGGGGSDTTSIKAMLVNNRDAVTGYTGAFFGTVNDPAPTTTKFVVAGAGSVSPFDATRGDDFYNDMAIVFVSGNLKGRSQPITDWVTTPDSLYNRGFFAAPTNGDTFMVMAQVQADIYKVSNSATAADNLELDYTGTGFAKTNSTVGTVTTLTNDPTWDGTQRDSLLDAIADANKGNFMATGFSTHTAADVWLSGTRTLTAFAIVYDSLDFTDDFWEKLAGVSDSGSNVWNDIQRDSVLAALGDANMANKIPTGGGSSPWSPAQRDSVLAALADANMASKISLNGGGAYTVTVIVTDTGASPDTLIPNAIVTVNNLTQSQTPYWSVTLSTGAAPFNLDAGTWVVFTDEAGFAQRVDTITVVGPMTHNLDLYRDGGGRTTVAMQFDKPNGLPWDSAQYKFELVMVNDSLPRVGDTVLGTSGKISFTATSNANGFMAVNLWANATVNDTSYYHLTVYDKRGRRRLEEFNVYIPFSAGTLELKDLTRWAVK